MNAIEQRFLERLNSFVEKNDLKINRRSDVRFFTANSKAYQVFDTSFRLVGCKDQEKIWCKPLVELTTMTMGEQYIVYLHEFTEGNKYARRIQRYEVFLTEEEAACNKELILAGDKSESVEKTLEATILLINQAIHNRCYKAA